MFAAIRRWVLKLCREFGFNINAYATNVVYEAVTCQTCHDPHNASNPHQLRTSTTVAFNGNTGFVVTNAGLGGFCMNCHNSRNGSVTNSL